MKGKSCRELEGFAESILNWALTINSKEEPTSPECFCSSRSCQMNVAEVSPYVVVELTNFQQENSASAYNGPNCFNAAFYASKTVPSVSFTHPYETTALLQSSLCKERSAQEALKPGDLLVVRDQSQAFFEIHAGVYVGDFAQNQLSFSKYGESKMMAYSYGLNVHEAYGVRDEQCARLQGVPAPGEPCYQKPFVNYYSCKAMYTFVSQIFNQPGGIEESVRLIYAGTSRYDNKISRIALHGDSVGEEELRLMQADLLQLYKDSITVAASKTLNQENREFLKLTHFHIYSLYEQTRRIAMGLGKTELAQPILAAPSL